MSGDERPNTRPNAKTPKSLGVFRRELLVHLAVCQASQTQLPGTGLSFKVEEAIRPDLERTPSLASGISQALAALQHAGFIRRTRQGSRGVRVRVTRRGMAEALAIAQRHGLTEREHKAAIRASATDFKARLTEQQIRDSEAYMQNPQVLDGLWELLPWNAPSAIRGGLQNAETRLRVLEADDDADPALVAKLQKTVRHLRDVKNGVELGGPEQRDLLLYYAQGFIATGDFPLPALGTKYWTAPRRATFAFSTAMSDAYRE